MTGVLVVILHRPAPAEAGALTRWLASSRAALAERHRRRFERAGAAVAHVTEGSIAGTFGSRLRGIVDAERPRGLVVLGSGAIPLAMARDRRRFIEAASAADPGALANNRYSADIVAIARADRLPPIPDLPTDNALPRWLDEVAGVPVRDRRSSWRLAMDLDSPLDIVLLDRHASRGAERVMRATAVATADPDIDLSHVHDRLDRVRAVAADPRAEIVVTGRTSASSLSWLERHVAARTRALVEERGMRAASRLASSDPRRAPTRRPASALGALLDRDGAESLGAHLGRLGEGALIDSRVLLAHRLGTDERTWPTAEDRFASDLLLPERVVDPWLRELTLAASSAAIPIVLGGHSLVGPGVRLALRSVRSA